MMNHIGALHPSLTDNASHMTRMTSKSFSQFDKLPSIIDKKQAKWSYHLQRAPNRNTKLYLDSPEMSDRKSESLENFSRKHGNGSFRQPVRAVHPQSNDVPDKSMVRLDLQQLVPSYNRAARSYPSITSTPRCENGSSDDIHPPLSDRTIRYGRDPDGFFLFDNSYTQSENYFPSHASHSSDLFYQGEIQHKSTAQPQTIPDQSAGDDFANSQATSRRSWAPSTYETDGSDPFLKSHSCSSLYDTRSPEILKWDHAQPRHIEYYRKPFDTVALSPRANQISGYSDSVDAYNLQAIGNPAVDFQRFTVLGTEQSKHTLSSPKTDTSLPTGHSEWSRKGPFGHCDYFDDAYTTTTAAVHRALPIDHSATRHTNIHGMFSKSISNILPYNPYHPAHHVAETVNGSLDSRPHLILQQLPRIKLPPRIRNTPKPEPTAEGETKT